MLSGPLKSGPLSRATATTSNPKRLWKTQADEILRKSAECADWMQANLQNCAEWISWDGKLYSGIESRVILHLSKARPDWNKFLAGLILKPIATLCPFDELETLSKGTRWEITKEEEILSIKVKSLFELVKHVRGLVKHLLGGEFSKNAPYREYEAGVLLLLEVYKHGVAIPEIQDLKDHVEKYRRADSLVSNSFLSSAQLLTIKQGSQSAGTAGGLESNSSKQTDAALSNPVYQKLLRDELIQYNMTERLQTFTVIEAELSSLLELTSMDVPALCRFCDLLDRAAAAKLHFEHATHINGIRDSFKWLLALMRFYRFLEAQCGVAFEKCNRPEHLLVDTAPQDFDRGLALNWVRENFSNLQSQEVDGSLNFQELEDKSSAFTNLLYKDQDHSLLDALLAPVGEIQLMDPKIMKISQILRAAYKPFQIRSILLGPTCSLDELDLIEEELSKEDHYYSSLLQFVAHQKSAGLGCQKQLQSILVQVQGFLSSLDESSIAFTDNQRLLRNFESQFKNLSILLTKKSTGTVQDAGSAEGRIVVATQLIKSKEFRSCVGLFGLLNCASNLGLKGTISRSELSLVDPFLQTEEYQKLKNHPLVSTILETRNQLKIYEELLAILFKHDLGAELGSTTEPSTGKAINWVGESPSNKQEIKPVPRLQISQVREHLKQMCSDSCVIDYSREVKLVMSKVAEFEQLEEQAIALSDRGPLGEELFICAEQGGSNGCPSPEVALPLPEAWNFCQKHKSTVEVLLEGSQTSLLALPNIQ